MSGENPSEREETEQERLDRQLNQLLNELRVAMPGVQVLFAFLLTVAFQQRFAEVTDFQRDVYFVTLLAAAAASALFIAPTAYHRLVFREGYKPQLIQMGSRLAVAGIACLAIAMNGAVLLVTDVLFDRTTVIVTVAVTSSLYIGLWFGLGLVRRLSGEGRR
jgi:cation transport ATPase